MRMEAGILSGASEEAGKKAMQRIVGALQAAGEIEPGIRKGVYSPTVGDEG